ncbi:hypothetical protein FB567DRAFT_434831 [Paraphoma chrysanthemicola]|uniref:Zn(2)-C6 fungal-type domain-containing protein n=1 Tax=Paraphoma chrysanthemicola TaxID=798071 RepID=A0A8K0RDW6_9PLEO|nr:hypothetical protein FB567DRAFT_434831 [Paraphoma chrysanthemicola]
MPPKRPSEDEPPLIHKIQRIEHGLSSSPPQRLPNNDFSGSVKRKLADSKRTGQACDRCKIRKIRCDGRPEGCTPCEQNRTPCQTTDRITGRATVRGHAEAMESENAYLRRQIADLQDQLKENGIEPRPLPAYNGLQPPQLPWSSSNRADDTQSWSDARRTSTTPHPGYTPASASEKYEYRPLPEFKHGSIGDNYLGVGAGDSLLSHIRGTSLSVFGTEIDITDYMSDEAEYESSVMSYSSLVKTVLGGEKVDPIALPPYAQLKEYAVWYLRSLNPYTMLVHKPAFMDLIWKFGNDPSFRPTPSETVTVHMMLATIQYQIATRNSQGNTLMDESHRHYRYALSFYKQLLVHRRLEDMQALAMICHHLRNFPKPGAAWIMTSTTYLFALELGLHRSVKNWTDGAGNMTKLEIEMRKRIFWTLNALQVNLNGRLGRPMPISNEDIDVEFPDPMNDCLPEEEANLDSFHQCSFQVGIQIAKYTVLEVDLYKMIYSVRYSPSMYVERMKRLEAGIKQWKDELPYELRDPSHASTDDQIFTLYLEYWYQAYHLLLHHPAVCRSTDPSILDSNLDKCLDAAQKMLQNCNTLMLKKSLDIPWINAVVYIAAMFTTLFISSNRKEQLSSIDMEKLRSDMTTWVSVLGECDHFLGSGDKLKNTIAQIAEQSLSNINDGIIKRAATESLVHVEMQTPQQATASAPMYDSRSYQVSYSTAPSGHTDPALTAHSSTYTSIAGGVSHPYNLGTSISTSQQPGTAFDHQQSYSSDDPGMTSTHAAALAAASGGTSQPSDSYTYANTHAQTANNGAPAYSTNGFTPQDWRQWSRTYMQPQPLGQPGEYLNTATTLMALGRDGGSQNPGNNMQGSLDNAAVQGHTGHVHWPELAFPNAANGHGHMGQQ